MLSKAVSRRLFTSAAWVQAMVSPYGLYSIGPEFPRFNSFSSQYHFTNVLYQASSLNLFVMEGQTGEAWGHPKRTDVLLDNGKHKNRKITRFVLCRLQNVKRN